jgi:hypothetical protein
MVANAWMGTVECPKHGKHKEYLQFCGYDGDTILCQRCYWDMLKANSVMEVERVYDEDDSINVGATYETTSGFGFYL